MKLSDEIIDIIDNMKRIIPSMNGCSDEMREKYFNTLILCLEDFCGLLIEFETNKELQKELIEKLKEQNSMLRGEALEKKEKKYDN